MHSQEQAASEAGAGTLAAPASRGDDRDVSHSKAPVALWQAQTAEALARRYADKRGCEVKVRRVCPRGWPCGTPGAVETLLRVSKTLGAQTACYDVDTSPFGWEDLSLEFRKGKLVRLTWGHPQGEMGKARRCVEDVIRRTAFPLVDHVTFSHRIYLPRALRR